MIWADRDDPTRSVAIDAKLSRIKQPSRRQGRSRMNWIDENISYAYKKLEHIAFDQNNSEHVDKLMQHASCRNL